MLFPDHPTADDLLRGNHNGYRANSRQYPPIYDTIAGAYVSRDTFVHPSTGLTTVGDHQQRERGAPSLWSQMTAWRSQVPADLHQHRADVNLPPIRSLNRYDDFQDRQGMDGLTLPRLRLATWTDDDLYPSIGSDEDDDSYGMDRDGAVSPKIQHKTLQNLWSLSSFLSFTNSLTLFVQASIRERDSNLNPAHHRGFETSLSIHEKRFDSTLFHCTDVNAVGDHLIPKRSPPEFQEGCSKDGAISQPATTPQKRQHPANHHGGTPSKRLRHCHSSPLPSIVPSSLPSQASNHVQNNTEVLDTLFLPTRHEGKPGFCCTYKCPRTQEVCGAFLSGRERRNRYRHAALHAQSEAELVKCGVVGIEDVLLLKVLPKLLVACNV